jgi:hypothetical protein
MMRFILVVIVVFAFLVPMSHAQMRQGDETMHEMMEDLQEGETSEMPMMAPGYGMMGKGYGYGGRMMGQGMMGDCGMMGSGMMGYGGHMGGMMGSGMMGRGMGMMQFETDEEYQKHLDDTADIRKEINNKQFDYREAMRDSEVSRDTLIRLKKEMLELKVKMYDRMLKQ